MPICTYCKFFVVRSHESDVRVVSDVESIFSSIARNMIPKLCKDTGLHVKESASKISDMLMTQDVMRRYHVHEMAEIFAFHFLFKLIEDQINTVMTYVEVFALLLFRLGLNPASMSMYHVIDRLIKEFGFTDERMKTIFVLLWYLKTEGVSPDATGYCPTDFHSKHKTYSHYATAQYRQLFSSQRSILPVELSSGIPLDILIKEDEIRKIYSIEFYEYIFKVVIRKDILAVR